VVTTHLVDAEQGFEVGSGRILVDHPRALNLRLAELARLTLLDPDDRLRFQRDVESNQALLVEARRHGERGQFALAIEFYGKALKVQPNSIEIRVGLEQAQARARQSALEAARRREIERAQALAIEFQRRQIELAQAAEAARLRAERETAAQAEAVRRL